MARKLIVEVVGDSRSLERTFARSTSASRRFGNEMNSSLGKAEARFTKFQRVAAGGFVGGALAAAGITALKRIIDVSAESQQVLGQTRVALEATGKSWETYGKQIEDTVQKQSRLGFDDEALLRTFSLFQRTTGDVNRALTLNSLAMDVARARFIDLEQAATLVNKAALGQAGALRRLGIDARTGADATELLTLLTEKYGGSAQAASNDARTSMDRVKVSVENLQESLGTLLLPAIELLADDLAAAADTAGLLVDGLRDIGNVKIPKIELPFDITIGGRSVGDAARGAAGVLKFTPLNPLFGITIAKAIADQFRDQTGPGSHAQTLLADEFANSINTLTTNALDQAKGKTNAPTFNPADFAKLPGVDFGSALADQVGGSIRAFIAAAQRQADAAIKAGQSAIGKQKQEKAFQNLLFALQLNVDKAELTSVVKDDIDALRALKAGLQRQIAAGVDVQSAQSQLVQVTGQIAAKQKEIATNNKTTRDNARDAAKAAEQARQFRALGLGPTGDAIVPGVENLAKRIKGVFARVNTGDLNIGSKLATSLRLAQRLIKTQGDKLTEETRRVINEFIRAANGGDATEKLNGPLTTTEALRPNKILEGLGLSRDMEKELRARLSQFNSAGLARGGNVGTGTGFAGAGQPVVINTTVQLDGKAVGQNTKKFLLNDRRFNPPQKRGPNAG